MKWNILLMLGVLALAGCTNSGPNGTVHHDSGAHAGVIDVPGYSVDSSQ